MDNRQLHEQVEALLFTLGALSRAELAHMLSCTQDELARAIEALASARASGGITLVDDGTTLELRTSAGSSELIENVRKDEYAQGVGRAGLEALAAVLYRGPLTRSEIDFIRGVNSSQTLRTLTMRGLVRRIPNPKDERSFLYEPTTKTLSHLGISRLTELPEYTFVREKLQELENAYRAKEASEEHTAHA